MRFDAIDKPAPWAYTRFMGARGHHRVERRSGFLILALLALWIQVLVPPGFMVAPSGGGAALVICTGHGPLALGGGDHSGKAPKPNADAPCVFAGHGLANGAPLFVPIAAPLLAVTRAPNVPLAQPGPGRGLAAPPPPARGPPLV